MPAGCEFRHAGLKALERIGREWHLAMNSPSPSGIRAALQAGIAVSVMPASSVGGGLCIINDLPSLGTVTIVAHQGDSQASEMIDDLVNQIRFTL